MLSARWLQFNHTNSCANKYNAVLMYIPANYVKSTETEIDHETVLHF